MSQNTGLSETEVAENPMNNFGPVFLLHTCCCQPQAFLHTSLNLHCPVPSVLGPYALPLLLSHRTAVVITPTCRARFFGDLPHKNAMELHNFAAFLGEEESNTTPPAADSSGVVVPSHTRLSMDQVQDDAVTDLLKIIGKAEHEVQSLPQTSADFETCSLRSTLCGQLDAQLGAAVDEALGSQELRLNPADAVCPDAINKVVARLAASPPFVGVVNKAREAIEQAAEAQLAAAATPVANATGDSVAATGAAGVVLRRNVDALSSSDTEREDMRVKKKAARRDDWVGIFDLSGGLGGGGGISPRVDIEAALGQLETGLGGSGSSTTSSVEALGLLAQVGGRSRDVKSRAVPRVSLPLSKRKISTK